jgi:predicted AlkP superfamily pyrophosphatase or phosphodiesterase
MKMVVLVSRLARYRLTILSLFLLATLPVAVAQNTTVPAAKKSTLIILLDGFPADLVNEHDTPNLVRLGHAGVRAPMLTIWPAISSPNHWALVTGLNAEHSGVYHNSDGIWDPANKSHFTLENPNYAHGEPVWTSVERQGRVSGVIGGWMGGMVAADRGPSWFLPYFPEEGLPDERADLALAVLSQAPEARPDFLALYVIDVDHALHVNGVGSKIGTDTLHYADAMVGKIMDGLKARKLSDSVNLIVVSDHGMMNLEPEDIILSDHLDFSLLETPPVGAGPVYTLWPKPGKEAEVYRRISTVPHLKAYRAGEIPKEFACCRPDRQPPILLVGDPGWSLANSRPTPGSRTLATHGFDLSRTEMHALFVAAGPDIKPGSTLELAHTIDVYSLLTFLVNVPPELNDGSISTFCGILATPAPGCGTR